MWALGMPCVPFELEDNPQLYDFTSAKGFALAVALCLSLRAGGFLLAAPVCSSWVWLNRGTSLRCEFCPLGMGPNTQMANGMVSKLAVLLRIVSPLQALWVFEQPAGSLMQLHPRMQDIFKCMQVYRSSWRMSDFGGATQKPTWLYANRSLEGLAAHRDTRSRTASGSLVTKRRDTSGRLRVTGAGAVLKHSQHYPQGFGRALASVYQAYIPDLLREEFVPPRLSEGALHDQWEDALIGDIITSLS